MSLAVAEVLARFGARAAPLEAAPSAGVGAQPKTQFAARLNCSVFEARTACRIAVSIEGE